MKLIEHNIALKEWAVTIEALLEGELIMVMRKGGIKEETKQFSLKSPMFYLMPAYEHQKEHLLKPHYQGRIASTLDEYSQDAHTIRLKGYAEVAEDIEIFEEEQLLTLTPYHIWTDEFAKERLKWKKKNPLHILLLRVYKLEQELVLDVRSEYTGCKSWVTIDEQDIIKAAPVLTDVQFNEQVNLIKAALSNSFIPSVNDNRD